MFKKREGANLFCWSLFPPDRKIHALSCSIMSFNENSPGAVSAILGSLDGIWNMHLVLAEAVLRRVLAEDSH